MSCSQLALRIDAVGAESERSPFWHGIMPCFSLNRLIFRGVITPMNAKGKVVVAMSGGVDSSVSAALLKEQGFEVVGVFMKCWNAGDFPGGECTSEEDEYWARRAAAHIDIPFYSFDLVDEYKERVVDYFVAEYEAGRTPNPDVMCNSEIKFGVFFDKVMATFAPDYIATGHYARLHRESSKNKKQTSSKKEGTRLLRGVDKNKDQSYFLYRVDQGRLAKTLFPVGEYEKPKVRELAHRFGLPNADKKDSQGICFIGNVDIKEFLRGRVSARPGAVVRADGKVVGEHEGLAYYTIGQRRGVGSYGGGIPYYVVGKNAQKNELIVGRAYDEELSGQEVRIGALHWIGEAPQEGGVYTASIRYRQAPQEVRIHLENTHATLHFSEPQRAVTRGQSAVLYDGDVLLGGGIIEK